MWNRKEAATLLMTGASIIAALQAAVFGKYVDALIGEKQAAASLVAAVGFVSSFLLAATWWLCRYAFDRELKKQNEGLKPVISYAVLAILISIVIAWALACLAAPDSGLVG